MEVWATKGGTFLKAEASYVLASGTWRQYAPAMKSSGLFVFLYCRDSGRWHFFPAPHHCITLGPPCWPLNNMDGLHIIQCKIFQLSWDFHKDHPSCLISRSLAPTNMPHLCPDGSTWLDPGEAGPWAWCFVGPFVMQVWQVAKVCFEEHSSSISPWSSFFLLQI